MPNFEHDTRVAQAQTGWQATLSPNWQVQGPQGGYVAAIALRAMAAAVEEGFIPVSLTGQFLTSATAGPAEIDATLLRQGRQAAFTTSTVKQEGKARLGASACFFHPNDGPGLLKLTPPDLPPPEQCQPMIMRASDGQRFTFHENLELLLPEDAGLGATRDEFVFWARYREQSWGDDPLIHAAALIPLLDMAVFPASYQAIPTLRGAVSLDLTIHWHNRQAGDTWIGMRGRCQHAGGGMLNGWAEAWTPEGVLLATGTQQVVIR
ncbi:MAG TPA: thioesterase family protein [Ktedonobacterales bacterium]|jgi:acyl-CoA thioesterase